MIPARCQHTGELVQLALNEVVFISGGPGELACVRTLVPGELVWQVDERKLLVLAPVRDAQGKTARSAR